EARGRDLLKVARPAALRAGHGSIAPGAHLEVYVTVLPEGADPDELARKDPQRLKALLAEATPVLQFVLGRIAARFDLSAPDGRRRFLQEAIPLLAEEPFEITRDLYLGTLSRLTGVDLETLRAEVRRSAAAQPPQPAQGRSREGAARSVERPVPEQSSGTERYVVAQLIEFPEAATRIDLAPSDLVDPELRAIFEHLRSGRSVSELPALLAARVAALGAQTPEPATEADPVRAIEIAALRVREQGLRRRLDEVRAALSRDGGDPSGLGEEMERVRAELDRLMRSREQRTVLRPDERVED
ncbi:MAG: hypothetical protein FJ104_09165, partial [Deltaproteobacteria bacterium]|nr:hypothetical protein [Deltaproteobacteria bacterium]